MSSYQQVEAFSTYFRVKVMHENRMFMNTFDLAARSIAKMLVNKTRKVGVKAKLLNAEMSVE